MPLNAQIHPRLPRAVDCQYRSYALGMDRVWYSVVARMPNKSLVDRYVSWLREGHIQAVLDGGANRAAIIECDSTEDSLRVRTLYEFPSRDAFDRYVRDFAPTLRAEGLARFGSDQGVTFEREIGTICAELRLPGPN